MVRRAADGYAVCHNPHPDIEIGCRRTSLEYFLTFPSGGMNADTGVVFCIPGYGDYAASPYQKEKLRPYLADRYNCITAGVNFFGMELRAETQRKLMLRFARPQNVGSALRACGVLSDRQFGDANPFSIEGVAAALHSVGVRRAGPDFMLLFNLADKMEYESFGLLPAIDHLTVLGDILRRYTVNKKRIAAFGSSYGGYIGLLLGKFAPRTFSMIVDNSGFVGASEKEMVTTYKKFTDRNETETHGSFPINGVEFPALISNPWTIDDRMSLSYLSEDRLRVRSLLGEGHYSYPSPAYHIFHSVEDDVVPIADKDAFVDILEGRGIRCFYRRLDRGTIDGRIFKNTKHGMDASLRGIFDIAYEQNGKTLEKEEGTTDFDCESTHHFSCGGCSYRFYYKKNFEVDVRIVPETGTDETTWRERSDPSVGSARV